jgi:nucleoside phosphorylase
MPPFTRPTSRAEFKIAVICAQTIEANAVVKLFDGFYDDNGDQYGKAPGDPNAYTTGRIGKNHVVLAHMPGMGKGIASSVASYFKISYPGIELALLVGICSGVPYGDDFNDIFLGDVIVSDGLVQYDLGKRLPDQFMRKDTLRNNLGRPNQQIRSLLAMLRTDRRRRLLSDRLSRYLTVIGKELWRGRSGYPGAQKDRLFNPSYRHKHHDALCDICGNSSEGRACYRALFATCEELDCQENMVIRRRNDSLETPKQAVHFGVIASGDTLMMSGQDRDKIASGEDIIGFETEGAGVWDNLPCIVVKGVYDYADSHRNKEWQSFAAASAAACMRALLDESLMSAASSLTGSVQGM